MRNNTLSVTEMFAQINSPTVGVSDVAALTKGIQSPGYSADDWVDYLGTSEYMSECAVVCFPVLCFGESLSCASQARAPVEYTISSTKTCLSADRMLASALCW